MLLPHVHVGVVLAKSGLLAVHVATPAIDFSMLSFFILLGDDIIGLADFSYNNGTAKTPNIDSFKTALALHSDLVVKAAIGCM